MHQYHLPYTYSSPLTFPKASFHSLVIAPSIDMTLQAKMRILILVDAPIPTLIFKNADREDGKIKRKVLISWTDFAILFMDLILMIIFSNKIKMSARIYENAFTVRYFSWLDAEIKQK